MGETLPDAIRRIEGAAEPEDGPLLRRLAEILDAAGAMTLEDLSEQLEVA